MVFDITRKSFAGDIDTIRQKYEHEKLSREVLMAIGKMTGSKEIMEMGNDKEVDSMCTAFEKLKQEGVQEGKLLIIKNLLANGLLTEEIRKAAGVTEEEVRRAAKEKDC